MYGKEISAQETIAIMRLNDSTISSERTVSAGIIGGFLAQGYDAWDAARLSVFAHGHASDQLAKVKGRWGYLASEVADWMPQLWIS